MLPWGCGVYVRGLILVHALHTPGREIAAAFLLAAATRSGRTAFYWLIRPPQTVSGGNCFTLEHSLIISLDVGQWILFRTH